jgi:hypothetical protein
LRIGNEQSRRNAADRNEPLGIGGLQVEWTCPDILLIIGEMDEELALVRMEKFVSRLRPGRLWLRLRSRGNWSLLRRVSRSLLRTRKGTRTQAERSQRDEEPPLTLQ